MDIRDTAPASKDSFIDILRKILQVLSGAANGGASLATSSGTNSSTTAATLGGGSKTVAAAATAEAVSTGLVESVEISNNTGADIFVGRSAAQPRKIADGDSWSASAPGGKKLNLATIFVKVSNDGNAVDFLTLN